MSYAILAVGVVLVAGRLVLRRRRVGAEGAGEDRGGRPRRWAGRLGWATRRWDGAVPLVAAREVRQRGRSRVFRVGTAVVVAAVVLGVALPVLLRGGPTRQRLGVVGPLPPSLRAAVAVAGARVGVGVRTVAEPSVAAADAALRAGRLDLVLVDAQRLVTDQPLTATDTSSTAQLARALAAGVSLQGGLEAAGLPPLEALRLANPRPLPMSSLVRVHPRAVAIGTTVTILILIYVLLSQYGAWILMGVVEEKASRVVEVLLATIRPVQLLAGKVAGIGAMALGQGLLVVAAALATAAAVGSNIVKGASLADILGALLWLVLGYAFYCWVYAAAGSLVERQEDVQTIAFPLQVPMLVGYVVCIIGVGSSTPSTLQEILAYLPPTAPFAMPLLIAEGAARWWQVALSVGVTLAGTVLVVRVATLVFSRAVLRTGTRVRLRDLRRT